MVAIALLIGIFVGVLIGMSAAKPPPATPTWQTGYDLYVTDTGPNYWSVVMRLNELTGLGVENTADLVGVLPAHVNLGMTCAQAEVIRTALEELGAQIAVFVRVEAPTASPCAALGLTPTPPPTAEPDPLPNVDVILVAVGPNKLDVIRAIREATGLGLRQALDLVNATLPTTIQDGIAQDEAERIKAALEEVGATVDLQ